LPRALEGWLGLLASLIAILTAVVTVASTTLAERRVTAQWIRRDAVEVQFLRDQLRIAEDSVGGMTPTDTPDRVSLRNLRRMFAETDDVFELSIRNGTSAHARGVIATIPFVTSFSALEAYGTFLTNEDAAEISRDTTYDADANIVHVGKIQSIPPGATIRILLLGQQRLDPFEAGAHASFESGEATLLYSKEAIGVAAILVDNQLPFALAAIAAALLTLLRRLTP
jgi:hypothetical protein